MGAKLPFNFLMNLTRKLSPNRDGNAAIEFALFAPVAVFALTGLIEFGSVVWNNFRLDKGVTAGISHAQYDREDTGGIQTVSLSASGFSSSEAAVSVARSCECPSGGVIVCTSTCPLDGYKRILLQVTMTRDYTPLIDLTGAGPQTLSRSATVQLP